MTRVPANLVRAWQSAARRMADRTTPLVRNEWYVAAFASEVGRALLPRVLLGKPVVMYRTVAGGVVALEDRCVHRSFPLSRSRLDGDTIVCGYHGFRYDDQGNCIEVPSMARCPRGIGVHAYPVRELGPFVWIWMGDAPEPPRQSAAMREWHGSADWECSSGYLSLQASYVRLHENLLDLTHIGFLHEATLGSADYASAPYDVHVEEGRFSLERRVLPTVLPPIWGQATGLLDRPTAARVARSEFLTPAAHEVNTSFFDTALPESNRPVYRIRTAHMITPGTQTSTHYFLVHGRDFAREDASVTERMHDGLFAAFREDVEGLGAQEAALALAGDGLYEVSIPADEPAVAMRQYLLERVRQESAAGD